MNPRLVKFAVELNTQAEVKEEQTEKSINFKKKLFDLFKPAKVSVTVPKNH